MNNKKKNSFPLYVLYEETIRTIKDNYGYDGPYTGFREEQKNYELKEVSTVEPESYYHEHCVLHTDNDLPEYVYVVLVKYTNGGTFCRTNGNGHIEGVYDDASQAEQIALNIKLGKYNGYSPWDGYFESLECVEIKTRKIHHMKIFK